MRKIGLMRHSMRGVAQANEEIARKVFPCSSRREAIINRARNLFIAEGFRKTSMSAVAARVGGSKATLYNYFSSKTELFTAVVRQECVQRQAALSTSLQPSEDDVATVLVTVGGRYVKLLLSDDVVCLYRLVIAESTRFPDLSLALCETGRQRARSNLAAYVESQMEAGRLRSGDAEQFIDHFLEMCVGRFFWERLMNVAGRPKQDEINANVNAASTVILAAYVRREGRSLTG